MYSGSANGAPFHGGLVYIGLSSISLQVTSKKKATKTLSIAGILARKCLVCLLRGFWSIERRRDKVGTIAGAGIVVRAQDTHGRHFAQGSHKK